ncbi:MAG: DegT/DnrJ/EryC1/StrS family aminotransferase, partial [Limibaculum sp.]
MWARTQLKIGWLDLLAGAVSTVYGADRDRLVREVEAYWDTSGDTIAAYSVRSGFDLLLQAMELQPGDEVVFSALNVKGMVKIVRRHGLVPVPVDLDIGHMAPSLERLKAAITPRSRVLVVAHLFGTRLELDPVFDLARQHGILIAEDCAQAFSGRGYPGHPKADVAMFSFGPLKTATALGGALIRVRGTGSCGVLRERMRAIQADYPMQTNRKQRKRVMQFAGLKIVTSRLVLQAIYRLFSARGRDYEDAIADNVRNVAPLKSLKNMRYRPSRAMLAMMARRLRRFRQETLDQRAAKGRRLRESLGNAVVMPALDNTHHDYWVFPILIDDPPAFIHAMRAEGFDTSSAPRSQAVPAPPDRPQLEASIAARALADLIIVPCYPDMPDAEIEREARVIKSIAQRVGSSRTR